MLFRADLTGNPRAVSPLISNNGMFVNALSAQSITLAAGAPVGAVLIGNGTIYAPVANGGFTFGNNGNGYWVIDPTGHIHQWGVVSGTISTGRIIPFAIPFTNAASVVPVASAIITHGSGIGYPSITNGSVTTTQFGVEMGSNPSQGIYWSADGY
jgi:hypothetical protein